MADREKLIELINRSMNYCPPNVGSCRNCPYFIGSDSDWCDDSAAIADHLIANGVTIQKCGHKAESAISETGLMCAACHSDIDRDAVFCKYCGARMLPEPPKGE